MEILNSVNRTLGTSDVYLDVQSNEAYSGEVELLVMRDGIASTGHVRLTFETSVFNHGPVVMNYG